MFMCMTIGDEQAAVALALVPWPGKRPTRVDIGVTSTGGFVCRLRSEKNSDPPVTVVDAPTPERAVLLAVEHWLVVHGADAALARQLSQRFSN